MSARIRTEALSRHSLLPLRLFLGVTFCYAGLVKLGDPHYLASAADPASYAAQLHASLTAHSPASPMLRLAQHAPTTTGTLLAFAEIAVGLGTLAGFLGRSAAAGGAALSTTLFATVSWRTHPYFLDNDLAYLAAWTPLLLAGTPTLSLDALLAGRRARPYQSGGTRRQALAQVSAAVLAVAGSGLLMGALAARNRKPLTPASTANTGSDNDTPAPTGSGTTVAAAKVPVGSAAQVRNEGSGDPIFVVQPKPGNFCAFSGTCTHAGCTILPPKDGKFICPCHGSEFDTTTGAVLQGPAQQALKRYAVTESAGTLHIAPEPS